MAHHFLGNDAGRVAARAGGLPRHPHDPAAGHALHQRAAPAAARTVRRKDLLAFDLAAAADRAHQPTVHLGRRPVARLARSDLPAAAGALAHRDAGAAVLDAGGVVGHGGGALRHRCAPRRSGGPDTLLKSSMEVIMFARGRHRLGVALLLALDNLGVQIKPLLAGLGIGGIALALAVQTVLADLLASLVDRTRQALRPRRCLTLDDRQGDVSSTSASRARGCAASGRADRALQRRHPEVTRTQLRSHARAARAVPAGRALRDAGGDARGSPARVREIIEATPDTRFDRCHLLRCTDAGAAVRVVYFVTGPTTRRTQTRSRASTCASSSASAPWTSISRRWRPDRCAWNGRAREPRAMPAASSACSMRARHGPASCRPVAAQSLRRAPPP